MKRLLLLLVLVMASSSQGAIIIDHSAPGQFDQISNIDFEAIRDSYEIFYGHTSHGGQLVSGMEILESEDSTNYALPLVHELSSDLGGSGDLTWVDQTRSWLADNSAINMVMWSWCGGCSENTEEDINTYLNAMTQLENEYPEIIFVYMTGHLDGTGTEGTLNRNNDMIRDYCLTNDKVLFDFADIESYDPSGVFYPDESDVCSWCDDWCATNECPPCSYCAHTHCFNCYQKGKSFWWMLFKATGGQTSGATDNVPGFSFELSQNYPNPFNPSTDIRINVTQPGQGTLGVFDLAGNRVSTLYEGYISAGTTYFTWNAESNSGDRLSSGVYFCRLQIGSELQEIKMTLLK